MSDGISAVAVAGEQQLLSDDDSSSEADAAAAQARPFLKWAGGKTQLLKELGKRMPRSYQRYFEPFVGGGALYFSARPAAAHIGDINSDLINVYQVVRSDVERLIESLRQHRYEKEYYYALRDLDRTPDYTNYSRIERASRFIYLNKTCYNGLYRVNSKGQFNTPFGRYRQPTICDAENLRACAAALATTQLHCGEFSDILAGAGAGDFAYLDPPYAPASKTANFTGYSAGGFTLQDQERLAGACRELDSRGVQFMLSNASTPEMIGLYQGFNIDTVYAPRAINSRAAGRGSVGEIIVTNY